MEPRTIFRTRPVEPGKAPHIVRGGPLGGVLFQREQPWRFIVATKADPAQFDRVFGLLMPRNQQWAKTAYALGFSAGKKTFSHNGAPNRFAVHDAGAATATLAVQATALGLRTHFMGGFDTARARSEFHIPDDFELGAAFAIGYIDEETTKPPVRTRKELEEIVFAGDWGNPAAL